MTQKISKIKHVANYLCIALWYLKITLIGVLLKLLQIKYEKAQTKQTASTKNPGKISCSLFGSAKQPSNSA